MNETEKKIESVFGGKTAANAGESDVRDARIAELERELQRERVESGRLKKTNDELAALREENARLREQRGVEAAIASVPEEVRNEVAPEVQKFSGAMMASVSNSVSERISKDFERQDEEIRKLREENARRDRSAFNQRINLEYPGFIDSVADGGDKHDAWVKYQRYNADTIFGALNANDFDTISYHIRAFYRELGIPVPSGKGGASAPDPRALGGGSTASASPSGKTYTQDEYNALFDQKEAARDRGDYAEVKRLTDEINRARAEGRIKD